MSQFESGGFDDFAPPPRGGYGAPPPGRGPPPGAYGAPPPRHYGGSGNMTAGIPRVGAAHAGQRFGGGGGLRPSAPTWVPDASVTGCSSSHCGTQFDTFERRHHCRYCGLVFCGKCTEATSLMPPQWEGGCGFSTRDPQRVCGQCRVELEPHQRKWIEQNCNANRTNALDLNDSTTRYLNSPLRFTLGGEVRKAGSGAGHARDAPDVKGSSLGRVPRVSADVWTSDHHFSERPRRVDVFFRNARARNARVEAIARFPRRRATRSRTSRTASTSGTATSSTSTSSSRAPTASCS